MLKHRDKELYRGCRCDRCQAWTSYCAHLIQGTIRQGLGKNDGDYSANADGRGTHVSWCYDVVAVIASKGRGGVRRVAGAMSHYEICVETESCIQDNLEVHVRIST